MNERTDVAFRTSSLKIPSIQQEVNKRQLKNELPQSSEQDWIMVALVIDRLLLWISLMANLLLFLSINMVLLFSGTNEKPL